jgi:hypothetical protein
MDRSLQTRNRGCLIRQQFITGLLFLALIPAAARADGLNAAWHAEFDRTMRQAMACDAAPFRGVDCSQSSRRATLGEIAVQLPAVATRWHLPDTSPIREFARRAKKEGLPLVRVWQNDALLVSLGLDPKGRPGLWLLQRLRD